MRVSARRYGVLVLSLLLLMSACRAPAARNFGAPPKVQSAQRDLHVLIVTDFHLDFTHDPQLARRLESSPLAAWPKLLASAKKRPYAQISEDTNPALFLSALNAMRTVVPHPDAVLVPGDLLGHDFRRHYAAVATQNDDASYRSFVDKTAEIIPAALHAQYPQAQLLPEIGNNDGYCGDYATTPHDVFLARQAKFWEPFANTENKAPNFVHDYAQNGYYSASLLNGVRVIGLNSIVFSKKYQNTCGVAGSAPAQAELGWLRSRLQEPDAPPTIVLTHIPPGIDAFKSFLRLGKPTAFYDEALQQQLFAALTQPSAHVATMISGHLHNVGYRVIPAADAAREIPVYSSPSISPIFGNGPAFVEADISKSGRLDNVTVYQLRTGVPGLKQTETWYRAYNFNQRYNLSGITAISLHALHNLEQSNIPLRETLEGDRVSDGPAAALASLQWRTAWCSELALTPQTYIQCEGLK